MIDPTTNVGKLRLRVGDFGDLPFLPDSVYEQTLIDTANNLPRASATCAAYILGMLAFRTHRKLATLEVWGAEAFTNYMKFLEYTISNPTGLARVAPIPYSGNTNGCENPLVQFTRDWNANYVGGTQSQLLHYQADPSYGCCGNNTFTGYDPIVDPETPVDPVTDLSLDFSSSDNSGLIPTIQ